eukprot:2837865-Pyramimonas_sp.AAC.1
MHRAFVREERCVACQAAIQNALDAQDCTWETGWTIARGRRGDIRANSTRNKERQCRDPTCWRQTSWTWSSALSPECARTLGRRKSRWLISLAKINGRSLSCITAH